MNRDSDSEETILFSDNNDTSCSSGRTDFYSGSENNSSENDESDSQYLSDSSTVVFSDDEIDPMTVSMDGMSVFYTNADNLVNKIDELKVRVILKRPDIIVITEVYPKAGESTDIFPSELNISGYNTFIAKYRNLVEGSSYTSRTHLLQKSMIN